MGKTVVIFRYLLLPLLLFSNTNSYSQDLLTKELSWANQDSIETIIFSDTNQIIDWGKDQLPFSRVFSKDIVANNKMGFVLMVSGCSGLPCWNIYVFKEKEGAWHLAAKTNARLKEQIKMDTNRSLKKIVFKTKSNQIGELPFDVLD